MYRFAIIGETTPPCGTPQELCLPPVNRRVPFVSVSSTGVLSQSLIRRRTSRSTIRAATDFRRSPCGIVSKYFDRSASTTSVYPWQQQTMDFLHGIDPAAARTIAVGIGFKVRLEDRLQHQFGGRLDHPVPNGGNAERPFPTAGLWDHHPAHRLGPIRLGAEVFPDAVQPGFQPVRLDHRERHPVHPWGSFVRAGQGVGMPEHVVAMDLVVEQIEAEGRLRLRLEIELSLKRPDPLRCCRLIANHPSSASSKAPQKSGSFPPPALTGLSGTMPLSDSRQDRRPRRR